jgi:hypothetical protein
MLGSVPNLEEVFMVSMEADIYPLQAPELAENIEGSIGEGSHFHETYGYYAQGVGPDTAMLPSDWLDRVHRVQYGNTNGLVGYCLDVIDLFLAMAVAAREKDRDFCMALIECRYVTPTQVLNSVPNMPLDNEGQRKLRATIRRWVKAVGDAGHNVPDE